MNKKIRVNGDLLTVLLAAFCIGYYYLCGFRVGFHVSLLKIWLWGGRLIFLLYIIKKLFDKIFKNLGFWHGFKHICKMIGIVFGLIFSLLCTWIISGCFQRGQMKPDLEYIIILGAAVIGTEPSYVLNERILTAYEYLKDNPKTLVIASGGTGQGKKLSEAECIAQTLIQLGIDPERILLEDQSSTTIENLENSYKMIAQQNCAIGIVTSDFHVSRAAFIAHNIGFTDVVKIPAPYFILLFPHYMIREIGVLVVDVFRGNIDVFKGISQGGENYEFHRATDHVQTGRTGGSGKYQNSHSSGVREPVMGIPLT